MKSFLIVFVLASLRQTGISGAALNSSSEENLCGEGWTVYSDTFRSICLYFSTTTSNFDTATASCAEQGGQLAFPYPGGQPLDFLKSQVLSLRQSYWLGLSKDSGYGQPLIWSNGREATAKELESSLMAFVMNSRDGRCGILYAQNSGQVSVDYCTSGYPYVCQKIVQCPAGRFGPRCERECHCLGEPCDLESTPVVCKSGCQRGWLGPACDVERVEPQVNYYCLTEPEAEGGQNYAYVQVNTNGIEQVKLMVVNQEGVKGDFCTPSVFESYDVGSRVVSFSVRANDERDWYYYEYSRDDGHATCSIPTTGWAERFTWVVEVRESPLVTLENDVDFLITCNFSSAHRLSLQAAYQIEQSQTEAKRVKLTPSSPVGDVTLDLLDASTKRPLTSATQGTPVVLRISYGVKDDSPLFDAYPSTCTATEVNSSRVAHLTSSNGCPTKNSPISKFERTSGNTLETNWFPLFSLSDNKDITFQCDFNICLQDNCTIETLDCDTHRVRRDVASTPEREGDRSQGQGQNAMLSRTKVTKVIHVLSDDKGIEDEQRYYKPRSSHAPHQHHHAGQVVNQQQGPAHPDTPLLFLNPITCWVFMLILIVFLAVYVTYMRSVRESLTILREDMEARRTRDKFVQCGCKKESEKAIVTIDKF